MLKKILYTLLFLTITLQATTPTEENVAKLYVATFNRAPDAGGLQYWVEKSNLSLEQIAQSFFDQEETQKLYPDAENNKQFLEAVYSNLFNRLPDSGGAEYWLAALDSAKIQRSVFILTVINGALGDDAIILKNKTAVGLAFADAGMNDIDDAREILKDVDATDKSLEEALRKFGLDPEQPTPVNPTPVNPAPVNPAPVNPAPLSKQSSGEAGWYMRIKASVTNDGIVYSHNTAGVFGELQESIDGKDRHDIPAYSAAVFQVVFPHYDWEEDSGDYWSDYRIWEKSRADTRVVYTFLLRNQKTVDLSNASLRLFVDPPQNVNYIKDKDGNIKYIESDKEPEKLHDFTLVDVDNHQTYAMDELENANLSMDGNHTRTFRLVRGSVADEDFDPIAKPE